VVKHPAFIPDEVWPHIEAELRIRAATFGWNDPGAFVKIQREVLRRPSDLSRSVLWSALGRASRQAAKRD